MNIFELAQTADLPSVEMLGVLNQTTMGVIRFGDDTPWEWHSGDELVLVLAGEVQLFVEGDADALTLRTGDLHIVPAETWHRQSPSPEATLLFATDDGSTQYRPYGPTEDH